MKKIKFSKETVFLSLIVLLSAAFNFINLSKEGTANQYYAAAVKSMTKSFKNFFFVSFDPTAFVTIDKPPLGYWFQAISAKIFGFHGWSILLPQALASILSVVVIYYIVKRSFGSTAGLISSLFLAITPVFVVAGRNNSVDNTLVLFLLLACWALTIAAEKGKMKYLVLSMVLVGLGFNIKMLEAYMVLPALYITYLLSTSISIKKRILNLTIATAILFAVSLSWAVIVDLVPKSDRPYIDSSTDNTVMELIVGHNGLERLGLGSKGRRNGPGGNFGHNGEIPAGMRNGQMVPPNNNQNSSNSKNNSSKSNDNVKNYQANNKSNNQPGNPPNGMPNNMRGNFGGFGGGFGGQSQAGIFRLFSNNKLSDQASWLIIIAILGFIVTSIKEKLRFKLDTNKKQSLVLWFMWFLPCFIYFSFTTGLFHEYYLTMLAPPIAALTGIGLTTMWTLYKEGTWKSWFLPGSLIANGSVELVILYNLSNLSSIVKIIITLLIILCFGSSLLLIILNLKRKSASDTGFETNYITQKTTGNNLQLTFLVIAVCGIMIAPFVGSGAAMFYKINGTIPAGGLELLSSNQGDFPAGNANNSTTNTGNNNSKKNLPMMDHENGSDTKLIDFLKKNKTKTQKYLLVVSSSNSGSQIILNTDESVMSLGGFMGQNNPLTLSQFKSLVKKGEVRYVMTGGQGLGGGGSSNNSKIMNWVKEVGQAVSTSKYSTSNNQNQNQNNNQNNNPKSTNGNSNTNKNTSSNDKSNNNLQLPNQNFGGFGGREQLYDLNKYIAINN